MQNAGYSLSITTLSYFKLVKSGDLHLSKANFLGIVLKQLRDF